MGGECLPDVRWLPLQVGLDACLAGLRVLARVGCGTALKTRLRRARGDTKIPRYLRNTR